MIARRLAVAPLAALALSCGSSSPTASDASPSCTSSHGRCRAQATAQTEVQARLRGSVRATPADPWHQLLNAR